MGKTADYSDFTCQDCCHTFRVTGELLAEFPQVVCPECSSDNLQEHENSGADADEHRDATVGAPSREATPPPVHKTDEFCPQCGTNLSAKTRERDRRRVYMKGKRRQK